MRSSDLVSRGRCAQICLSEKAEGRCGIEARLPNGKWPNPQYIRAYNTERLSISFLSVSEKVSSNFQSLALADPVHCLGLWSLFACSCLSGEVFLDTCGPFSRFHPQPQTSTTTQSSTHQRVVSFVVVASLNLLPRYQRPCLPNSKPGR